MAICEWCGKEFDEADVESIFEMEFLNLSYSNVRKCLCAHCLMEAMNDEADGIYYETCEKCGKEFDYYEECSRFDSYFGYGNGTSLTDYWDDILCADCAIAKAEKEE